MTTKVKRKKRVKVGRRPGNANTREDIFLAAKSLFAKEGYVKTTLRKIAMNAGVDVALVRHYFGSKDEFFAEILNMPKQMELPFKEVFEGPRDELGDRLVRAYLRLWEDPEFSDRLMITVRSAFFHEHAMRLALAHFENEVLVYLSQQLNVEDAGIRVSTAFSFLFGVAMSRYAFRVGQLENAEEDKIVAIVAPAIHEMLIPRNEPA